MPQQISIQDTRNNLADLINQADIAGRTFVITKFGKPKAMLGPVIQATDENKSGLEAAFGLWKDRKDIKDSAKWVEELRTKMSLRVGV